MSKLNYQKQLEQTLLSIEKQSIKAKLLLHSCCAPCSSYVLEYLSQYFEITVLYYNPNISPEEEYFIRGQEQKRLIEQMSLGTKISFLLPAYDPTPFFAISKGYEKEPEGGQRCCACFNLRLSETAKIANEQGFDFFTTTLSISPHKDAQLLNSIGKELSELYGVPYLYSDFKKRNGYRRSCELSQSYNLYRQNYCGCIFSKETPTK